MQIKGCHFTCIKLATGHDCTINLKKIDPAVSELEDQLGLAERVSAGVCSQGARAIPFHMKEGLDIINWTV